MNDKYDNTNRGTLGKNNRKTADNHPDYSGNINVEGKDYWLSAWVKDGDKGKFLSLSIKPKEDRPVETLTERAAPAAQATTGNADDLPF